MAPKEESYSFDHFNDLDKFTNYNAYVDVVKTINTLTQKQKIKPSLDTLDGIVDNILSSSSTGVTACKLAVLWDFFPIFQPSIVKKNSQILCLCSSLISNFLSENSIEFDSESLTAALKITSFVSHEQNKLIDSARGKGSVDIIAQINSLIQHPYCLVETALIAGRTLVNLVLANSSSDEESLKTLVQLLKEMEESRYMQLVLVNGILHVGGLHVLLVQEPVSNNIFIMYLFKFVKEFCSVTTSHTFQNFHCFKMWSLRLKEICQKVASDSDRNYRIHVDKSILQDSIKILTTNWENPSRGVPDLCLQTFKYMLDIVRAAWKDENESDEYIDQLLSETMKLRWSQKSKYPQLNALISAFGVKNTLARFPDLPTGLSTCLASNHLTNAGMEVYKIVISDLDCETWCKTFGPVLISSLISDQPTIRQNCLNHWLPATLRLQPQTASYLSNQLSDATSPSGWIGRLSLFKLIRQAGAMTSLSQDDFDCVSEGLVHTNPEVRSSAFSVLCHSKKLGTPPEERERQLLAQFIKENANVDSSQFRQTVGNSFSILLRRCRDYATQMYRNKLKGKSCEMLMEIIDFLHQLLTNIIGGLLPGGNYQRKISSLELLGIFIDNFVDFKSVGANKKSGNGDPKEVLKFANDLGKITFLSDHNMEVIVLNVVENMNDVREKAAEILTYFTPNDNFIEEVVVKMLSLLNSPKYPECESGAILAKLIANWSHSPSIGTKYLSNITLDNQTSMCHYLLTSYKNLFKNCESDFLSISRNTPMHGFLLGLRRCLLDKNSVEKFSFDQSFLAELIQQLEESVEFMLKVLSGDLQNHNNNPSFQQMASAIDSLIAAEGNNASDDNIEDTAIPEDHQLVLAAAWLNLKECAMMAGSLVSCLPIDITPSPESTALSLENVGRCGDVLLKILTVCRHKGAIVSANTACGLFSSRLLNSNNAQLRSLPGKYLQRVLDQLAVSFTSITRRSAGLPMLVQKLVGSEPRTRQRLLLPLAVNWLLDISKDQTDAEDEEKPGDVDETKDVPRSHSLHILQGLVHDASIAQDISPYICDIVATCITSFSNRSWAIRNAGLQLWGALAPRILGQKKVREEEIGYGNLDMEETGDFGNDLTSYNVVSYKEVASRHPGLFKLFLERLTLAGQESKSTMVDAALVPILSLLSRIAVDYVEEGMECYEEIKIVLRSFLTSPVINVRSLTAKTLVCFTEKTESSRNKEINLTIAAIVGGGKSNGNHMHGLIMFLKQLILKVDRNHKDVTVTFEDNSEDVIVDDRLRKQAVEEKERGNEFFKAGKYDEAIEKYTAGIRCDPTNAVIPANRAMALLKKEQYGAAERDTSTAISIDNTYIKAYQRRASARVGLGKLEEAIKDFDKVLELEPHNKAAKAEKEKLLKMIKLKNKRPEEIDIENIKLWLKSIRSENLTSDCFLIKIEVDSILKFLDEESVEDRVDYKGATLSPGYFQWKQLRPNMNNITDLSMVTTFQEASQYLMTIKSNHDTIDARINAVTDFLDQSVDAAYCNGLIVSNALNLLMEKDMLEKLSNESEAAMDVLFSLEHERFKSGDFGLTSETQAMFLRANCLNGMMVQEDWEMFFRDSSEYVSSFVEMSEAVARHSEARCLETSRSYAAKSLVALLPALRARNIKENMPLVLQYGFVNLINSVLTLLQDEDSDIRMEATKFGSGLLRPKWPETSPRWPVMVKYPDISTHLTIKVVVYFGFEQLAEVIELFMPFVALFVNPFKCRTGDLASIGKTSYLFEKGDGVNVYEEGTYMLEMYKDCFIEAVTKLELKMNATISQDDLVSVGEELAEYLENVRAKEGGVFGKERTKTGYRMTMGVLNLIGLLLQFDLVKGGIGDDVKDKLTIVNNHLQKLMIQ